MNKEDLHTVTNYYRSTKIPFDGLHIDVDFQVRYSLKTFSRKLGVCCLILTLVIFSEQFPNVYH